MSFKEQSLVGLRKREQGFSDPSYQHDKQQRYDNNNNNLFNPIIEEDIQESGGQDSRYREEIEYGFEEKIINYNSPIEVKNARLQLGSQILKHLAVSQKAIIAVTESNQILRWKFEVGYDTCEVFNLPKKVSSSLGKLATVGEKIGGKIIPFKRFKQFQKDKKLEKEHKREVERAYMDSQGDHCLVTNNYGHTYYLGYNQTQLKYFRKMKSFIAKCITFDDRFPQKSPNEDKICVIGGENNSIYICKLEYSQKDGGYVENVPTIAISVSEERPKSITDIRVLQCREGRFLKTVVLASTSSQIFFFVDNKENANSNIDLDQLFKKYQSKESFLYSLPTPAGHIFYTDVSFENAKRTINACHSFIYTSGHQLQYYKFPQGSKQAREQLIQLDDNFFRSVNYFCYAKQANDKPGELKVLEMPIGVGITSYHYVILHSNSVSVLSQITQQVVFFEDLSRVGKILGIVNDMETSCYWIYGDKKVVRLFIKNEVEQSLRIYTDRQEYEKAYQLSSKLGNNYVPHSSLLLANQLFDQTRYTDAAKYYLESDLGFDEVFVRFQNRGRNLNVMLGLAEYITGFLEKYKENLEDYQKSILVNWLADFMIHKLAVMQQRQGTEGYKNEVEIAEASLLSFMEKYKDLLIEQVMYELLSSYGQLELCLKYGLERKNYDMVIRNYVHSERFSEAIEVMKTMPNCIEVAYQYSDILMKKETPMFIELITKDIQKYDLPRLMRSLMGIERQSKFFKDGLKFLEFCVKERKTKEQMVHNIYIFFLAEHTDNNSSNGSQNPSDSSLFTRYMIEQENRVLNDEKGRLHPYFDMNFAFNLALAHDLHRALISQLGMRKLFEEAVDVALQWNMIEVAIEYARKQEKLQFPEAACHKTWMKVIIHLMKTEKEGPAKMEKIFSVIESTSNIKMEECIKYFDSNLPLELFKGQIEESVKSYQEDIEGLKKEIDQKSIMMDDLKQELGKLSAKHIRITSDQLCSVCDQFLLGSDFIAFPCLHFFHKQCIIDYASRKHLLDQQTLSDILITQEKIKTIRRSVISYDKQQIKKSIEFYTDAFKSFNPQDEADLKINRYVINYENDIGNLKVLHKTLDALICQECPFCGPILASLAFVEYADDKTWEVE